MHKPQEKRHEITCVDLNMVETIGFCIWSFLPCFLGIQIICKLRAQSETLSQNLYFVALNSNWPEQDANF